MLEVELDWVRGVYQGDDTGAGEWKIALATTPPLMLALLALSLRTMLPVLAIGGLCTLQYLQRKGWTARVIREVRDYRGCGIAEGAVGRACMLEGFAIHGSGILAVRVIAL